MSSYKKYLFIFDDMYQINQLEKYIGSNNYWQNISENAFKNACNILEANVNSITLNDKYNLIIMQEGKNARVDVNNPITLFAPFCMTYYPDIFQTFPIGWPIKDKEVQEKGYETVQQNKPSSITFVQNNLIRKSPYTSHCSAYVAWITQNIFSITAFFKKMFIFHENDQKTHVITKSY